MDSVKWILFFWGLCFTGMLHSRYAASQEVQLNRFFDFFALSFFVQAKNLISRLNCKLFCAFFIHFYILLTVLFQFLRLKLHLGQLRCHPQLKVSLDPVWWSPAHITIRIQGGQSLSSPGCGSGNQMNSFITQSSLKRCSSIGVGHSLLETSDIRPVHWRLILFKKVTAGLSISGSK